MKASALILFPLFMLAAGCEGQSSVSLSSSLQLTPQNFVTPPATNCSSESTGSLVMNSQSDLYLCKADGWHMVVTK